MYHSPTQLFGRWLLISTNSLCFKLFTVAGYPFLGFVEIVYKLHFLGRGFTLIYKWNSVEFSVDFRELGYFRILQSYNLRIGIFVFFQTGYDIQFALRSLEWVSRNWDLLKATWRLPRVGLPGRGMTCPVCLALVIEKSFSEVTMDSARIFRYDS